MKTLNENLPQIHDWFTGRAESIRNEGNTDDS